jgi:large subunit ribosomal protein L14e
MAKRSKNRTIDPVYEKMRRVASKSGVLYGKPVKGTKPLPQKKPKVEGAKKVKKVKKDKKAKKPAKK